VKSEASLKIGLLIVICLLNVSIGHAKAPSSDAQEAQIAQAQLNEDTQTKANNFFGTKSSPREQIKLAQHATRLVDLVEKGGYDKGPSGVQLLFSVIYAFGPLAVLKYVSSKLAKDEAARKIKLQKEQGGVGPNPLAALLMQLQRAQTGGGENPNEDVDEIKLADSAHPVDEEVLQWNPHDILTPGKRKFFTVLLWISKIASVLGVVQLADVLKDKVRGNTIPAAMHQLVNDMKKAPATESDEPYLDRLQEFVGNSTDKKGFDQTNWGVRFGNFVNSSLIKGTARLAFSTDTKKVSGAKKKS